MHDAFEFEAAGLPIAWVDTPGRMPRVRQRDGVYRIDYGANFMLQRHGDPSTAAGRKRLQTVFEKFGLHRALRLAGAVPGDRVKTGAFLKALEKASLEFELWEYPEPRLKASGAGIRDYGYVTTPAFARLDAAGLGRLAVELAPKVEAGLLH